MGAALLSATLLTTTAAGAQCVGRQDLAVLRTAALQQELMVAALTCHEVSRYNHFVLAHRAELIDSDARLKEYFHKHGGEARYHTYQTELANAASLRSIRRGDAFCAHAETMFDLSSRRASLADFVVAQPPALNVGYHACMDDARSARTARAGEFAPPRHAESWPAERGGDAYDDEGDGDSDE